MDDLGSVQKPQNARVGQICVFSVSFTLPSLPFPHPVCYGLVTYVHYMAALWNRAGHYIFVLWFLLLSSFFLSFFLAYSQPSEIGCLPYFHTWCGLSANIGCRSETCCMQLAENTGCKKLAKIHHLCTIAQLCRAISSQLGHVSTVGKKTC